MDLIRTLCPEAAPLIEPSFRSVKQVTKELCAVVVRAAKDGPITLRDRSDPDVAILLTAGDRTRE
jgi:hypothetical protein